MNIVNVVNFIRSEEEYRTSKADLLETLKNQVALAHKYKFPVTFLFQHDAFTKKEWVDIVKPCEYIEIGMWLELNRSLVERAGCKWKGREELTWEYFSHIDLTCGYLPKERKRIIDIAMEDFKKVYGEYPKTVGSWIIDAVSLSYMEEKYGVIASLNCKDQWLTDGYSLWGGYYNQAYYPCKNNMFTPAQTKEEQINIPVFRMLGSDPIRQYDCGLVGSNNGQGVITLECYLPLNIPDTLGGSNENWVRWFFEQMDKFEPLTFGYAQAGQENPFPWSGQGKGYTMQMRVYDELSKAGKIQLMKVSDTAKFYREKYPLTPASVVEAETPQGEHGVWYSCKNFRTYIYGDKTCARVKDLMVFDQEYKERYLTDNCKGSDCFYDNLPLVDSFRWGIENGEPSGLKFYKDGVELKGKTKISTIKTSDSSIRIEMQIDKNKILIDANEKGLTFYGCSIAWCFANNEKSDISFTNSEICLKYNGFERKIRVWGNINIEKAEISPVEDRVELILEK